MTLHKRETPTGDTEFFVEEPGHPRYRYSCTMCGHDTFKIGQGNGVYVCAVCRFKVPLKEEEK